MTPTRSLILFDHEIRAALRGELRLVVRPVKPTVKGCKVGAYTTQTPNGLHVEPVNVQEDGDPWDDIPSPLGVPGDLLIGKETLDTLGLSRREELRHVLRYVVDGKIVDTTGHKEWWPRISDIVRAQHMPAWASRITMEVVSVGVGRLDSLTEDDTLACGVADPLLGTRGMSPLTVFRDHWNARYAAKGLGWDTNCWVWKCGVRRVEK